MRLAYALDVDPLEGKRESSSVFIRSLSVPYTPPPDVYHSPTVLPSFNETELTGSPEITNPRCSYRGTTAFIVVAVIIVCGVLFSLMLFQCRSSQRVKRSDADKENNASEDRSGTNHSSMECNTDGSIDSTVQRSDIVPGHSEPNDPRKVVLTTGKEKEDDVSTGSDSSPDNYDEVWNGDAESPDICIRIDDGNEDSDQNCNETYGPIDLDSGCNVKHGGGVPSRNTSRSYKHLSYHRKIAKRKKTSSSYDRRSPAIILQGISDVYVQQKSFGRLFPIPEIAFGDEDSMSLSTNRSYPQKTDPKPRDDQNDDRDSRAKRQINV